MTSKQAAQLRRAIAKLLTARADCDYARVHEPHKTEAMLAHQAKCARRLDGLIDSFIEKDVSRESCAAKPVKHSGVFPE